MKRRRNLILSSLLFLAALLAETYCFLEFRKDMLSVLGTGVILLVAAFMTLDSALAVFDGEGRGRKQQGQEEEKLPEDLEKHLADLEKMQKASFVVMKKNMMWQQRILHEFSSEMEHQRETVLKAGKLVAKYEKDGTAELAAVLREIAAKPGFDGDEIFAEIEDINKHLEKLSEELMQVKDSIENIQITAPAAVAAAFVEPEPENIVASAEEPAEAAVSEEISQELLDSVLAGVEPEPEPEPEPAPAAPELDLSDPNKMMSPDDIAALLASMGGEETPVEEPEPVPEPEPEPEPAPAAPELDLSDPNKMMSPDDIAALLASMGGEETPAEEPEPVSEPEPDPDPAPAAPELDLSDPNKMMSPDDIAALLASMGGEETAAGEPEPVPEPEPEPAPAAPELDLSDPNKMMSPDDIAALLASMGGEETAAKEPEPVPEPEPEPAPAAPELDLSDPNKMMSPDDIAALLASMGQS